MYCITCCYHRFPGFLLHFNPTTEVPRGSLTRPRSTVCLTAYRPKGAQISVRRWLAKVPFVGMRGGFFKIVADVSIACKIFGTHVEFLVPGANLLYLCPQEV